MSKKTFSAQEWENVPSKQEPEYSAVLPLNEIPPDLHVEVERAVRISRREELTLLPNMIPGSISASHYQKVWVKEDVIFSIV